MHTPVATAERPPAPAAPVGVDAPTAAGCNACPHPDAEHDAISARYCQATVASALDRACICRTA